MVGADAGLHANQTRRQVGESRFYLACGSRASTTPPAQGDQDGVAKISSGRWMPVRGGALSAKSLTLDGLQLPLQGLPAFLRSGMVHVDVPARRGLRGPFRRNGAL